MDHSHLEKVRCIDGNPLWLARTFVGGNTTNHNMTDNGSRQRPITTMGRVNFPLQRKRAWIDAVTTSMIMRGDLILWVARIHVRLQPSVGLRSS